LDCLKPSWGLRALPALLAFAWGLAFAVPSARAGNLDRFDARAMIGDGSLPAHPVCGLAGWDTVPVPPTGVQLRFPRFQRCRHLLTLSGWAEHPGDSRGVQLLGEVVSLLLERAVIRSIVMLGQSTPANLAVPDSLWIPAGCEATLSRHLQLSAVSLQGPGTMGGLRQPDRPADWAACQNRGVELFVAEYPLDTEILLLNRLSTVLDTLNLDDGQVVYRLHQARLLLREPDRVPTLAEVLAVVEGNPLPRRGLPEVGGSYPFRIEADPRQPMTLSARGVVREALGVNLRIEEATLGGPALAQVPWPLVVNVGLCMQPVGDAPWRMSVPNIIPLQLPFQQAEVSFQKEFALATPPSGINVPRYWVCASVTAGAGRFFFFHAIDAVEKGCKGCPKR
jgi:hypothetical protein